MANVLCEEAAEAVEKSTKGVGVEVGLRTRPTVQVSARGLAWMIDATHTASEVATAG